VGIILVYDVTDKKSFQNIDYWLNRIRENGDSAAEVILIGNKVDMINEVQVD
jgi:GTPase SAR1 family protein